MKQWKQDYLLSNEIKKTLVDWDVVRYDNRAGPCDVSQNTKEV